MVNCLAKLWQCAGASAGPRRLVRSYRVGHHSALRSSGTLPNFRMTFAIAERRGQVPPRMSGSARCPPSSGIAALAVYLAGEDAKILEREELDPALPDFTGSATRPSQG